tara:strand:- start:222 stop:1217 length:996 start_codon:yes stop_codon:yes gene_type:complete
MAQDTDFQIPNGTGQAVRLDIQTAILALASTNSGSQSNLGTTHPCQMFADTDNGLLKIRDTGGNSAAASATFHTIGSLNTANLGLLPASGGSMTGVLTLVAGSNSAPSVNFGDSTTGFFKTSNNVVGFSGAGNLSYTFSNNSFNLRDQRPARFYDSDSSQYVEIKAPSNVASSNKTLTLPDETGTILTSATSTLSPTTVSATTVTATNIRPTNIQDSSGNNGSTPVQIEQGRAKIWANFSGTGTPATRDDYNVSTITDHGVGDYTINFDVTMTNNDYAAVVMSNDESSIFGPVDSTKLTTNSIRIESRNVHAANAATDQDIFCIAIFGDGN